MLSGILALGRWNPEDPLHSEVGGQAYYLKTKTKRHTNLTFPSFSGKWNQTKILLFINFREFSNHQDAGEMELTLTRPFYGRSVRAESSGGLQEVWGALHPQLSLPFTPWTQQPSDWVLLMVSYSSGWPQTHYVAEDWPEHLILVPYLPTPEPSHLPLRFWIFVGFFLMEMLIYRYLIWSISSSFWERVSLNIPE